MLQQNEWRSYRGPRMTFVCEREISGSDQAQTVSVELKDFTSNVGPLKSWARIDQLGLCAHFAERGAPGKAAPNWKGPAPEFMRLEWA